jgi:hypothetical protein
MTALALDTRAIAQGFADLLRILRDLVAVSPDEAWTVVINGPAVRAIDARGDVRVFGRPDGALACKLRAVLVVRNGAGHLRYVSCEDTSA